jgi:eukaryotic-like serine/threonine-protein kinase
MTAKQGGGGPGPDFSTWVPSEKIPGTLYIIHKLVDQGGHGRLYKAEHEITNRVCAVKAIHRKYKTNNNLAARLKQEANINTRLSGHPNIAEVFEAGVTADGRTYCVMQWLEGTNLRTALKNRAGLDIDWTCFVVKSVLAALARAHRLGIVHRDVKPENIFLCDDGLVKLIDFGVAKVLNSTFIQTDEGMMPGTVRYMSPEAIDTETASSTTDIYSLGVVFWELLAGEHPFPQVDQHDAARAIVYRGVAPLDGVPAAVAATTAALRQVVMRACALDPAERFPSAEAFDEAIDRAMGYARSAQPLAAGISAPSPTRKVPASMSASAPVFVRTHSPGTALDVLAPPRVAFTHQAARSHVIADQGPDIKRSAAPSAAHSSSVLVRGQGLDSDQMPPPAPWVSQHPSTTPDRKRSWSTFGVLSHVPPPLSQRVEPESVAERAPSSTPPLVSGMPPQAHARAAGADAEASDEATTLPYERAAGAGKRWWGRVLPLGRVAERLPTAGGVRPVATNAVGVLALTVLAFSLGRAWKRPPERDAAAPAMLTVRGEASALTSALPAPAAQAASQASQAQNVLPPVPNVSATTSARGGAPSPSAAGAPATTQPRVGAPATTLEGSRAGAPRDPRNRTAPHTLQSPRRSPKNHFKPGF